MLEIKKKKVEYDRYVCNDCESDALLVPHHMGPDGKPEILIVMCPDCLDSFKISTKEYEKKIKSI